MMISKKVLLIRILLWPNILTVNLENIKFGRILKLEMFNDKNFPFFF